MKKLILVISVFFYLIAATGTIIHFHYCMGKQSGWSLVKDDKKDCGMCGMDKKRSADSGCCKEESKHAQLKIDQSATTMLWTYPAAVAIIHHPEFAFQLPNIVLVSKTVISRPPPRSIPVYLFGRNFRI